MHEVFDEFAELVGRVLAKRWMLLQEQNASRVKGRSQRRNGTTQRPSPPEPLRSEPAGGDTPEGS